ncbi:hypothetical protein MYAM1_003977 [Malassezia yamatoensis]|uniref:Major facilitator superfamily (MFS) profile domain-containing protein n=1 Tax=Malassezia yamatoensis TaxID=253288 RepID=A0AAJ5Z2J7_9BASI|nr:hypothetical protein MYAM1_003977 [Malassezia yamatoensis]
MNGFQNTYFGDLLHIVTRGKACKSRTEQIDCSKLDHYFETDNTTGDIIVGWYGDDDPECPYNWSFLYKCWVNLLLFTMTMSIYMGSSIVSPGIPDLAQQFGVSRVVATLSMSLFVWAYGFGPLILSPITEISWIGRNGPYIIGLGLFTILQIPNALVNNLAGYLVLRFLSGFLGSPVLATGGATVGDIWRIDGGFMNGLAFWGFGACGGPTIGPLISGYAVQKLGWRWSIWPLLCFNGLAWILIFFTFPETSSATILTRRARYLRKATGNPKYRSQGEIEDEKTSVRTLLYDTLCRPIQLTLTEPVLLCSNLYIAYLYGIMYCFFEAFPLALQGKHGFSTGAMGVAYISGYIGVGFTFLLFCIYNLKVVIPRFNQGKWKPEYRMEPAFLGGIFFPVALFWFGWTTFSSVHWISPIIAFGLFVSATFLLFQGFLSYIGENFPRYLASAYASNGLFRALVGGAFPLFATQMFERLTLQGGCSLLGGLAILLIPITVIFYLFGGKLRAMSKNAGTASEPESSQKQEHDLENAIKGEASPRYDQLDGLHAKDPAARDFSNETSPTLRSES